MAAAVTMAVAVAEVAMTTAMALTLGGNGSSHGIGEAESSKGGMVLHLQALGSSVGRGAVNKPTERVQERGRGRINIVIADLMAEVADSHPLSRHWQAQCRQ